MIEKILPKMWMIWFLLVSATVVENASISPGKDLYERINYNMYSVEPNTTIIPREFSTRIAQKHTSYNLTNIGQEEVVAKLKFGNLLTWTGDISVAAVRPNKKVILSGNGTYIRTGLEIRNNGIMRTIVYVEGGNTTLPNLPPSGFDKDRVLREAFESGAKFIPYSRGGLRELLKKFWFPNTPSIWSRVIEPVEQLLDSSTQLYIKNVLKLKIDYMKTRIELLYNETKDRPNGQSVSVQYMNLAQDFDRLENIFKINNQSNNNSYWINTVTIGLFATTVSLKVNFFDLGIIDPRFFNLTFSQHNMLRNYLKTTLYGPEGAIAYIRNLYTSQVENCYKTCYAGGIYDRMMNIRSHFALHGLEPILLWISSENTPGSNQQPYSDVISYSEFFGRPTAELYSVATSVNMTPPLTPELMANGVRRKLISIEVFIWRLNGSSPARVGGARLVFDGNVTYTMGTITTEIQLLKLNEARIDQVRAFGRGQVDKLVFTLSDGRVLTFGSADHNDYQDLKLRDHHIVSIFISSDDSSLLGQAANFAVSYRLNILSRGFY